MWRKASVGDSTAEYSQVGDKSYPHSAIDDILDEPDAQDLEEDDISDKLMDGTSPKLPPREPISMAPVEESPPISAAIAAREPDRMF